MGFFDGVLGVFHGSFKHAFLHAYINSFIKRHRCFNHRYSTRTSARVQIGQVKCGFLNLNGAFIQVEVQVYVLHLVLLLPDSLLDKDT